MRPMRVLSVVAVLAAAVSLRAAEFAVLPADPFFEPYKVLKADAPSGPMLRPGDRLAICGDSITEQKIYSRMMEIYLTVCMPDLGIAVRQYGRSGERCDGFLLRMTNDVLRFKPTVATTCYGMNDHRYKPYEEAIGVESRSLQTAIVRSMKAHGVRIVTGSSGTVNKMPHWVKTAMGTVQDLNLSCFTSATSRWRSRGPKSGRSTRPSPPSPTRSASRRQDRTARQKRLDWMTG